MAQSRGHDSWHVSTVVAVVPDRPQDRQAVLGTHSTEHAQACDIAKGCPIPYKAMYRHGEGMEQDDDPQHQSSDTEAEKEEVRCSQV